VSQVGPYQIHEQLGRGGLGAVFRATDLRDGREVALEALTAPDPQARRRLVHEARALSRLRHPSVVSNLDQGETAEGSWIARELVRGRSLQDRLDQDGPLAPREAARLAAELAAGLAHAHAAGVLHRRLEPANVLLPADGGPARLTDFGLAGFTVASPGYGSPEEAAGDPAAIGPATDVYGLGAVLYAALTGRPPIEGATPSEVMVATASRAPSPPGTSEAALDAIALRCLAKEPAGRPPSAEALRVELQRFLTAPRRSQRAAAQADARPIWLVGLVAVSAVVLVASVGALLSRRRTGQPDVASPSAPTTVTPKAPPVAPPTEVIAPKAPAVAPRPTTTEVVRVEVPPPPRPFAIDLRTDWRATREELDRALELDPRDATKLAERGWVKASSGDPRGALADCARAIELDPRHALAHAIRGWVRGTLGEARAARLDLDRALELDPRSASAHLLRGLYLADGEPDQALADLTRALELDPERSLARTARGMVLNNRGDAKGAIAELDRAVALDPADSRAFCYRGNAWLKLGDRRRAVKDLDRAIELTPTFARAYFHRGLAKERSGDRRAAMADYGRSIELDPTYAMAHTNRGGVRANLGDVEGGIADCNQALQLDPRLALAYEFRAKMRRRQGDSRAALPDVDKALELAPRQGDLYSLRALIKLELGDPRGAVEDCEAALRLDPGSQEAREALAAAKARLEQR
jgi:tetratricopeptide (TPR) repeat protein